MTIAKSKVLGLVAVFAALVASGTISLNATHYVCTGDGVVYSLGGGINASRPWIGYPVTPGKSPFSCKSVSGVQMPFRNCLDSGLCVVNKAFDCPRFDISEMHGMVCK